MMKKTLLLMSPLLLTACWGGMPKVKEAAEKEVAPPEKKEGYELYWHDEFEGTKLDMDKWSYRMNNRKRNNAIVSDESVSLDGRGNLKLTCFVDDEGKVKTGMISTAKDKMFKYGYFESRMKLAPAEGVSTTFWIQSPDLYKGHGDPGKYGVEIDVIEHRWTHQEEAYHTVHWDYEQQEGDMARSKRDGKIRKIKDLDDTNWHIFGCEWTPDYIAFYVDGKKTFTSRKAVSHREQYIILSLEAHHWAGELDTVDLPVSCVYDYVRVYKKKEDAE